MEQKSRVLVIGGAVYDITASILGTPVPCDSNPSRIYGGAGGVGRNIAENAARMGCDTAFITAFGEDAFSDALRASCADVGIDTSAAVVFPNENAGIYLSIMDKAGELQYAASDLTLVERIPTAELEKRRDYIRRFDFLFLDANLTEPMLETLAGLCDARIIVDAVSVTKSLRLRKILERIDTIKVNKGELAALSGVQITDGKDIEKAAKVLLDAGVQRVFVTMGMDGSCCIAKDGMYTCPAFAVDVRNVTGAGDAFAAAVTYGLMNGYSNDEILRLGTAASHIALQSPIAVSREMSEENLLQRYKELVSIEEK